MPTPPVRFEPAQVAALTGGLGTDGGARPATNNGTGTGQGGSGGSSGTGDDGPGAGPTPRGGGQLGAGRANARSGQGLGASAGQAALSGRIATTQSQTNQELLDAAESTTSLVNTTISTFDQLRTIQTGTATFDFGTVTMSHSGPGTGTGSYDAGAFIDFGAKTFDFQVFNVVYNFGAGNQTFMHQINGGAPEDYTRKTGFVTGNSNSNNQPGDFTVPPTDGSTVNVTGAILNNVDAGIIAQGAQIKVTIENGADVLAGSGVAQAEANVVQNQNQ